MTVQPNKIGIVGAGLVGSTTAFTLISSGLVSEIVLVDRDQDRAVGQAMDLSHGASFFQPTLVRAGSFQDLAGAAAVIITVGVHRQPGENRIALVQNNLVILQEVIPQITAHNRDCILIVVTNPVDLLTYAAVQLSGFPPSRVIGSGTVLDSLRFRYLISQYCRVDARSVHAYVVGEHGDSEVPLWSLANISGVPVRDFIQQTGQQLEEDWTDQVTAQIKHAAGEIIRLKGSTYFAVALAVRRILASILRDERSILTVSALVNGQYEIENVCLSLPCLITRNGVEKILQLPVSELEEVLVDQSAFTLQKALLELGLI